MSTFEESLYAPQAGMFTTMAVEGEGALLREAALPRSAEVFLFDVAGVRQALLLTDITYHHIAQGKVGSAPFMVTFCCVCYSGALMDPTVDGAALTFEVAGLYKGQLVLKDTATGSLWDHITGEALHGPLAGKTLKVLPDIQKTTVASAARTDPTVRIHLSPTHGATGRTMHWLVRTLQWAGGFPSPTFYATMPPEDGRLPRMALGLGVVVGGAQRFYPVKQLRAGPVQDELDGRALEVSVSKEDGGRPAAVFADGARPVQLFMRWYGFSMTYPACAVWEGGGAAAGWSGGSVAVVAVGTAVALVAAGTAAKAAWSARR